MRYSTHHHSTTHFHITTHYQPVHHTACNTLTYTPPHHRTACNTRTPSPPYDHTTSHNTRTHSPPTSPHHITQYPYPPFPPHHHTASRNTRTKLVLPHPRISYCYDATDVPHCHHFLRLFNTCSLRQLWLPLPTNIKSATRIKRTEGVYATLTRWRCAAFRRIRGLQSYSYPLLLFLYRMLRLVKHCYQNIIR